MKVGMRDARLAGRLTQRFARRALGVALSLAIVSLALGVFAAPARAQSCGSDVNGDGTVDGADLGIVLGDWGTTAAPTIATVSPPSGDFLGGTVITITGTYLCATSSVTVGGAACTNVTVLSGTQVQATTPPGAIGPAPVAVTTPGGTTTATNAFTYWAVSWATILEFLPDPAVVTNESLRNAIIATGLPWRVRDNFSQIEMLLVPPGIFDMGCSPSVSYGCNPNENPIHAVTLTNAYYVGRYEVTQAQWTAVMGSNPSAFQGPSYPDAANQPVEKVSWDMIQLFLSATGLRLLTEAEWEYAYRAGTTTAFHSGPGFPNGTDSDALVTNIAWYSANSGTQTHVVGGKAANALGLHDMSGNVREWVNDWYSNTYYSSSPAVNPPGPADGKTRVARGGSVAVDEGTVRSSNRANYPSGLTGSTIGFRVARAR